MNPLKKIAGYNLLAIVVYSILIRLYAGSKETLGILIYSAFAVGMHVGACMLIAFGCSIGKQRDYARAWLSAAGIVLLVGFSVCLGNTALK